jgi:uncharacterized protein YjbI with pentapeptide repeats
MADRSNPTVQALLRHIDDSRKAIAWGKPKPEWGGGNLYSFDLSGIDFSCSNMSNAPLVKTNLRGSNLLNTDLRRAYLRLSDLSGANLCWAQLSGSFGLEEAILLGARFTKGFVLAASKENKKLLLVSEEKITFITLTGLRETNHNG